MFHIRGQFRELRFAFLSACLKQWIILFLGPAMRFKQFSSYISDTARVPAHHNYTLTHKWKIEIKNGSRSIAYMSFYRKIFFFCLLYSQYRSVYFFLFLSKTPSSADAVCVCSVHLHNGNRLPIYILVCG